jgi:hypothetical protein
MPIPLEICLEELTNPSVEERFIRCVALAGGEPGLALDRAGAVRWMPTGAADYGLWVSADERLILLRAEGADPIMVSRAGRGIEAPAGKPVVLVDQDLLEVNGQQLRVHVHGVAAEIRPPERLSSSALAKIARAAAAALAFGIASGASAAPPPGAPEPIQVRPRPPAPMPTHRLVSCSITKMEAAKKGPVMVHATCPANHRLVVGTDGYIVDAKGVAIKDGSVVVKEVSGTKIVAESKLAKPVKADKVIIRGPH